MIVVARTVVAALASVVAVALASAVAAAAVVEEAFVGRVLKANYLLLVALRA
jgi:hypothetical protein